MEKKLKICGQEYDAKASFLTQVKYYEQFGKDFAEAIANINDRLVSLSKEKESINYIRVFGAISIDATRLAYVMIKEANPTFMEYEEWIGQLDGLYDETEWISEVVKLGFSVFRRTLSQ